MVASSKMTRVFLPSIAGSSLGRSFVVSCVLWTGCAAIYPEVSTPLKPVPEGRELVPPPPKNVLYIAMEGAEIPSRTRDGRRWDAVGGDAPDPFAILYINGKELFRTPVQANTLTPTWDNAPKGSYELPQGAKLKVEIWDDNPIHKQPICSKEIKDLPELASLGGVSTMCGGGTQISVAIKPAEAKFGLGFSYEFRGDGVYVSQVMPLSPASRAGLREGSRILRLMGEATRNKSEGEIKSLINANGSLGLKMAVAPPGTSAEKELELQEGPIYIKD